MVTNAQLTTGEGSEGGKCAFGAVSDHCDSEMCMAIQVTAGKAEVVYYADGDKETIRFPDPDVAPDPLVLL